MHFIFVATVYSKHYTNCNYALNVLQKPLSMTMVIKIELGIFDQIVIQPVFGPKNAETLKTIVCQTAQLERLLPEGFMKYDVLKQKADFFLGI